MKKKSPSPPAAGSSPRLNASGSLVVKDGSLQAAENNAIPGDRGEGGGDAGPTLVVGIGAGEGALKPLRTILAGLPSGRGLAVVLVHHPQLAKGKLTTLLKPHTALAVVEAADGMAVRADRIHVMPPDKFLNITAEIGRASWRARV